ncbi:MAG: hypothetical protein WC624_01840 [Candidatus Margulisiibacteriota bacterium]
MKKYLILGLFSLLLIAGCGEKSTHTDSYLSPAFNKDSNIVCVRGITESRSNMIDVKTSDSYNEFIEIMSQAGTSEKLYDDVTNDYPSILVPSPNSDQVAFGTDLRLGLFNKIVIITTPTSSYTGATRIELNIPSVRSFDWNSAGTHLIYCNNLGEIRSIKLDGSGDALITSEGATSVSAKYGTRIFYTYNDGADSKLAYWDNSTRTQTGIAGVSNICVSAANTNEVYCAKSNAYEKLDFSGPTIAESVKISSFTGNLPSLAPTGDKIVYYDSGIWTADFLGNKTKVK